MFKKKAPNLCIWGQSNQGGRWLSDQGEAKCKTTVAYFLCPSTAGAGERLWPVGSLRGRKLPGSQIPFS